MVCAEPKEHKYFHLGSRPGGSATGVTERLFMGKAASNCDCDCLGHSGWGCPHKTLGGGKMGTTTSARGPPGYRPRVHLTNCTVFFFFYSVCVACAVAFALVFRALSVSCIDVFGMSQS